MDTNRVFLAKLVWRYVKNKDSLWGKILMAKYGDWQENGGLKNKALSSSVWKSMNHGAGLLQKGLHWQRSETDQCNTTGNDNLGSRWWTPSSQSKFSCKSAYSLLENSTNEEEDKQWRKIWKFKGPGRASLVLWLLNHDRLSTNEMLWHRQIISSGKCDICGHCLETSLQAVRDCLVPKAIWSALFKTGRQGSWNTASPDEWIRWNLSREGAQQNGVKHCHYLFRQAVHDLWRWRNQWNHSLSPLPFDVYGLTTSILRRTREVVSNSFAQ